LIEFPDKLVDEYDLGYDDENTGEKSKYTIYILRHDTLTFPSYIEASK
jgi:hypothetical protein